MATWQYDIYLLPRSKVLDLYPDIPAKIDREEFDSVLWWDTAQLSQDYQHILDSFLPRFLSWNKEAKSWGSDEGNLVDISQDQEKVEEIFVRLDAREDLTKITANIIRFAKSINCLLLLMESMEIIEPDGEGLLQKVDASRAMQFVRDPKGFLKNLSRENLIN